MSDDKETAERIESWELGRVFPYKNNAKIHDPAQITKIARSIQAFGFDQPIVVDEEGVIIKGHGRRLAAIELGMKFVPVIVRTDLTEAEVRAARLSDNQVAKSEDDAELLVKELTSLAETTIDLGLLGFDDRELEFLTASNLDDMDMESLIDDLEEVAAEHDKKSTAKAEESKGRQVPLKEALGFGHVTVDQARLLNRFMAKLEDETGLKGTDALMIFVGEFIV